ncbi:MAG: NAD(P)-dependent oxidoreductase [Gammaproteobacteria bacterium]|nr:NAD(P)-dependent oxidoreductase [Gammaproteobacteria bacterium]MDH4314617.1 NAD(P)-dependent oxidoreductase [Gammaproteobacteria bacterium]MDH5212853.1 NAD(P)-dependent oxidoreductase [Gammaproteobacteria bacterium]MDH5502201.1 NAD(P)-dependent oxidoreductase [Gammaproteobacteria bacterium]
MRVAFAGLGVMGYPMAGYLAKAGHEVTVYNRTAAKSDAWVKQHGGKKALTPAAAAKDAEIVFCCVGNDDDVRQVILREKGILAGIASGAVIVDHTTASAVVAQEVHDAAGMKGVAFLDAPLSGGQAGAESGKLTIMAGGDSAVFERVRPVMDCYAKACTLIGPVGSGQKAKMVNQICIAGIVQGLAEGLHLAKRANLDVAAVIGAISKGAAQSWQMENRWQTMNDGKFDFGFAVEWMRKDLKIALEEADRVGAKLDMTRLVDGYYAEVERLGGRRFDTSSLIKRLEP